MTGVPLTRVQNKQQLLQAASWLETPSCRLVPLKPEHADALSRLVEIDDLWRSPHTYVPDRAGMPDYIAACQRSRSHGSALAYAIELRDSGQVVGTTRLQFINWSNARLQVGATWLGAPWRSTFVNLECKHALLQCAFEDLGFQRVEFCVDTENLTSRRAVERLGARAEGVLRNYLRVRGQSRDSAVYSCIDKEWLAQKAHLLALASRSQTD